LLVFSILSHWLLSPDDQRNLPERANAILARAQHFSNYQPLEDDTTLMAVTVK